MPTSNSNTTPVFFDATQKLLIDFFNDKSFDFSKIIILLDENTHRYCLQNISEFVEIFKNQIVLVEIVSGEKNKNIETALQIIQKMNESGCDRDTVIINLGGGVISDLGGFVASIYKRGVRFVNIPTTLLSMVDACMGGKTGIDFGNLKNQIGTFYNPEAIFIFTEMLDTLELEEIKSGYGEIIKYALIDDVGFFDEIKNYHFSEIKDWNNLIQLCLSIKNEIVTNDPKESGIRKILNLGHTIGHAFESHSLKNKKSPLKHGHAVALGIMTESYISFKINMLSQNELDNIIQCISKNFEIYPITNSDINEIIALIYQDKKNKGGNIFPILLQGIGKPIFTKEVNEKELIDGLLFYKTLL